eukprot:s779_g11.t1
MRRAAWSPAALAASLVRAFAEGPRGLLFDFALAVLRGGLFFCPFLGFLQASSLASVLPSSWLRMPLFFGVLRLWSKSTAPRKAPESFDTDETFQLASGWLKASAL